MTDSIQSPAASDCLGRTCLKWGADGELTAQDLSLVLQRLAQVDQEMNPLVLNQPDPHPSASLS
jgi:hypothetical protein